jgi:hypothetical protein
VYAEDDDATVATAAIIVNKDGDLADFIIPE